MPRSLLTVFAAPIALAALTSSPSAVAADYLDARYRPISAPDCVDASRMIAEYAPAPLDTTYMRVQHIGDPGTAELAGEIARPVTWDVGLLTGFRVPPSVFGQAQRGYRNEAPPNASSAFQLWCSGAGFLLDSRRFAHTAPVILAGPSVSIARDLSVPAAVFGNGASALTIEGHVSVPTASTPTPPVIEGTAQVSFFYYARDTTSGIVFAHLIELFDNRAFGINGVGDEAISADEFTPFVVSPLTTRSAFVSASPVSATAQFVEGWAERRYFRAHVSYAQFATMIATLAKRSPRLSPWPEDYRILSFGLLGEIFPGTGNAHEVALGTSVVDLALSEASYDVAPVIAVEYYNAARDHYFVSARGADIAALDSGTLSGWTRTGQTFAVYPILAPGTSPVCRFYLPPAFGDSHFFSASRSECADVATKFPDFALEDAGVMYLALPDAISGACPAGTIPVYRLWNGRAATNHRYTTNLATRAVMLSAGWVSEGYGLLGAAMCSPAKS